HQLLKLGRLGDEIGLAVDLDEDADLAAGVDVGADGAIGRRPDRLLGRLRQPALAQQAKGLLGVAGGVAEGLLAVEQSGARLLAPLLDRFEPHGWGPPARSPMVVSSSPSSVVRPPLAPDVGSSPPPRARSSCKLRPSITASATAAQNRRMARMT